jgi:hypothetical protein
VRGTVVAIRAGLFNQLALMKNHEESTYALLIRSEEKSRGVFETVAYTTVVFSAIFAIGQFAQHPVKIPAAGLQPGLAVAVEDVRDSRI